MKIELIRIGNSRGIRIPKPIIEQCGFGDAVELRVENHHVIIEPGRTPRQGWEEAFRAAGSAESDEILLHALPPNTFDAEEWEW